MLDYATHVKAESMYNTPPTYAVYVAGLVFKRLLETGGLAAAEQRNIAKAALLYDFMDTTEFYINAVDPADRSRMNVTFTLPDPALDAEFLAGAKERDMVQLKGHRSVGGMRASIYNAMPIEGVQRAGGLHDRVRRHAGLSTVSDKYRVRVLNQMSAGRPETAALGTVRGVGGGRRARCDPAPLGRPAQLADPGLGARGGPRRRRGEQHPGRGADRPWRTGLQRAWRERQRRQGTRARRHAAGGPEPGRCTSLLERLDADDPELDGRVEAGKKEFAGFELAGHTLGVIGLGKIGCLVADAAIKLGMKVIGYDPEITVEAAWSLPSTVKKAHHLGEVLKHSDIVTLHVPLLDATRNMIDAAGWLSFGRTRCC